MYKHTKHHSALVKTGFLSAQCTGTARDVGGNSVVNKYPTKFYPLSHSFRPDSERVIFLHYACTQQFSFHPSLDTAGSGTKFTAQLD